MANDYDATARNLMLNALGALAVKVALHTGDPGGANSATSEVTGGDPAYARKTTSWGAADAGAMAETAPVVFDVPASTTVTYISFWNTAGTVRYAKKSVTSEAFGAQGTYTLTTASLDLNS